MGREVERGIQGVGRMHHPWLIHVFLKKIELF